MATWPASLPQSLLRDLSQSYQPAKLRTQMDKGPHKQRQRFTAMTRFYDGSLYLDGTEIQTFMTFFETTIGAGAASFTWIDPIDDSSASLRFREDPKIDLVRSHQTPASRLYRVSLSLEKLP